MINFLSFFLHFILTVYCGMGQQRPFLLSEEPLATGNPSSPLESTHILYPVKRKRGALMFILCRENKYDTTLLSLKFKYLVMRGRFVPVLLEQVKWCRDGVGCVNINRCFVSYIFLITLSDGTIHPARQDKNTFYQLLLAKSAIPMSRCWLQISAIYKLLVGQWAISCEVSS